MTWLQFFMWVAGLYTLYYLLMILLDTSGRSRAKAGAAMSQELTFAEPVEAQKLEPEIFTETEAPAAFTNDRVIKPKSEPAMIGSGGVSLKTLFSMARDESVLYTLPVSF